MTDLPTAQRRIMRMMMRRMEMSDAELRRALEALPEGERLGAAEFDEAIAWLTSQNWLAASGEAESLRYRVNYRRRGEHELTQVKPRRRSGAGLGKTIWEALESGPTGRKPDGAAGESAPPTPPESKG